MWAVGIERGESRGATATDTLQCPRRCSQAIGRGPVARVVRGAGNADHGASPTADKGEGFFF
jgi:hypothetical protein